MKVRIETPWMEKASDAVLDLNESNLIFSYPETYYLDIQLSYVVDHNKGKAKFIKDKKRMEIDLPIIDLTEKTKQELASQR
jgi:hypothetical protein